MENNPYDYNKRIPWQTPQNQTYSNTYPGMYMNQPLGAPQALKTQQNNSRGVQKTPPARMPKARAVALARLLKKSLVVISLATFASFSGLVAYHQINTSASQKSTTSTTTSSSQKNNNTFLNQQGANNLGTSTPTATATSAATATPTSGSASGSNANASSGPASGTQTS